MSHQLSSTLSSSAQRKTFLSLSRNCQVERDTTKLRQGQSELQLSADVGKSASANAGTSASCTKIPNGKSSNARSLVIGGLSLFVCFVIHF